MSASERAARDMERNRARQGLLDGLEGLSDAEDGDEKATVVAALLVGSLLHVADRIADLDQTLHEHSWSLENTIGEGLRRR